MIIAAHCINFKKQQQNYLLDAMLTLARQYPQHHFIIFTEGEIPFDKELINIEWFPVEPALTNTLSLQYWYRFKLPGRLKAYAVNIFISEAGMLCKNFTTPQYLFLRPENKRQTQVKKIDNFAFQYPKLFAAQVSRANAVFVTEPALIIYLKNKQTPCHTIYHSLPKNYKPISFEEKEIWINANTEGCDFFVFHVSETTKSQVLPMLKAFSIFKKWTESSMRLVLLLYSPFAESDIPKFNLYKFRTEVAFVNFTDHSAAALLYAAAFLHIYLPQTLADENYALLALQTQTGLITTDKESLKLQFGLAAAYCSLNEKSIAEKLLYYYKNDFEKDNLIAHAVPLLKNYTIKNSAAKIAQLIGM